MLSVLRKVLPICCVGMLLGVLVGCSSTSSTSADTGSKAPVVVAGASLPGEPMTQSEIDYYMDKIESNLTLERTGREPEPTSFERIRYFAETDDGKPFYMINLVREYDTPTYPDWWEGERASSVLEAKKMYATACAPRMAQTGSYSTMGVTLCSPAVVTYDDDLAEWDQFYLIYYPNRKAMLQLLASDEYADAIIHKYAGDKDTELIPVSLGTFARHAAMEDGTPLTQAEVDAYMERIEGNLTLERTGRAPEPTSFERIRTFLEADDGKPFYMINLVREYDQVTYPDWWTGKRANSVLEAKRDYSLACAPKMGESGSYSMYGVMKAYPAVVTDDDALEEWDQFYLIGYPGRKAFAELLASDEYADAIIHKYAGDKDTLLIPVTANEVIDPYNK